MASESLQPKAPSKGSTLLLALFAFMMYASTLLNGHALDDALVITQNRFVNEGFSGIIDILSHDTFAGYLGEDAQVVTGGRYRPLSLVTFAMEVGLWGKGHPLPSHLINALLFALTAVMLFRFLTKLLPLPEDKPIWSSAAFFAMALFIAHPIHSEVVANIKGRDEILALLFGICAALQLIRFTETGKFAEVALTLLFGVLAFFSKESALPWVVMAPMLAWMVARPGTIRRIAMPTAAIVTAAAMYFALRLAFTASTAGGSAELLNDPYLEASVTERIATSFHCLLMDLKLLFVPFPLTHDYYPFQIELRGFADVGVILSIALHAFILGAGVWGLFKRKPVGFALLLYLAFLLPVSNLFVNTGVFMAERFLYMPSIGFCIVLALGLQASANWIVKVSSGSEYGVKAGIFGLLLFGFGLLTQFRTPVWKDNFTLFTTDAETSTRSARAQMAAGGAYLEAGRKETNKARKIFLFDESLAHLDKALKLYPDYATAYVLKGNAILERTGDAAAARAYFEKALTLQEIPEARRNLAQLQGKTMLSTENLESLSLHTQQYPDDPQGWYNLGMFQLHSNNIAASRTAFEKVLALDPDNPLAMGELGILMGQHYQDLSQSIRLLQQAIALPGGQKENFYSNLGIAYGMSKDYANSERVLRDGLLRFPDSKSLHQTLAATYEYQGRLEEAREEMKLAQ